MMIYKDIMYQGKKYNVSGLGTDSRHITKGMGFLAVRGVAHDGTQFINDVIRQGAELIITHIDMQGHLENLTDTVDILCVENPRQVYAHLCGLFYDRLPSCIMAVTGTNGKTSVANFAMQLAQMSGHPAICVGTMGICGAITDMSSSLTTPEPAKLCNILQRAHIDNDVNYVCVEASSHGLDMYRLDGIKIRAGAFTNLTHDHLDYHGDMKTYFEAKLRLFQDVVESGGTAVINKHSKEFDHIKRVCISRDINVLSYSVMRTEKTDLYISKVSPTPTGYDVQMDIMQDTFDVHIPLIGMFQLENILCALGLALQSGISVHTLVSQLQNITCVYGRMQQVATTPSGASVFVDYAHTPDALKTILESLRKHTDNTLHVVFGCGGDRDAQKRPVMGRIASEYADKVYVTDDNPRTENADNIRAEVLSGGQDNCIDSLDRVSAIIRALQNAQTGDIVVVAGKGHEEGQIIGNTVHPHNDAQVIQQIIRDMK